MERKYRQIDLLPQKKAISRLSWRQDLGKAGEEHVVKLLIKRGWQVIERNWRAGRYAEIDIIAYDSEGILVFIEVKTRMAAAATSGFVSLGYDKLDKRKIQKLLGCARLYMAQKMSFNKASTQGCRFDAFVVCYPPISQIDKFNFSQSIAKIEPEIQHIKDFIQ
jgi:putative endonuclease